MTSIDDARRPTRDIDLHARALSNDEAILSGQATNLVWHPAQRAWL